jgi:hypothetical protein
VIFWPMRKKLGQLSPHWPEKTGRVLDLWKCFPIYSRSFRCVKPSFRRFSMIGSPHAKNIR